MKLAQAAQRSATTQKLQTSVLAISLFVLMSLVCISILLDMPTTNTQYQSSLSAINTSNASENDWLVIRSIAGELNVDLAPRTTADQAVRLLTEAINSPALKGNRAAILMALIASMGLIGSMLLASRRRETVLP